MSRTVASSPTSSHSGRNSRFLLAYARLMLLGFICSQPIFAHNGPPFPIIENQRVGPCIISLWTHPDLGTGTFWVMISPVPGTTIPKDLKVQVAVQPLTGRLPEAMYTAWVDENRDQLIYKSEAEFDQQELWKVRLILTSSAGDGETVSQVTPTPLGFGRWDLLLFALPFLAVAFLWSKAMIKRRRLRANQAVQE